jgi:hypothetical protein
MAALSRTTHLGIITIAVCLSLILPFRTSVADGAYAYDPCVKLTIALVQPFFTAPINLKHRSDPGSNVTAECDFYTADFESVFQVCDGLCGGRAL